MKTEFHFHSTAFNCTEPKDYFINECCFGDDVGAMANRAFVFAGISTDSEPGQEDLAGFSHLRRAVPGIV